MHVFAVADECSCGGHLAEMPARATSTSPGTRPPSGELPLGAVDELVLDRVQRGLGPRREPELAKDVRHVRPRRPFRDEQLCADLLVAHPLPEESEHVLLAIGQWLRELLVGRLLGALALR